MKAIFLILALTFAAAPTGFAGDKAKPKKAAVAAARAKAKGTHNQTAQPTEKISTGSYLKEEVRRNGLITDGRSQVLVVDHDSIRNSGAVDVRQLLVWKGIH